MLRLLVRLVRAVVSFALTLAAAVAIFVAGVWLAAFIGLLDNPVQLTKMVWTALVELEGWKGLAAVATGGVVGFLFLGDVRPGGGRRGE